MKLLLWKNPPRDLRQFRPGVSGHFRRFYGMEGLTEWRAIGAGSLQQHEN